MGTRRHLQALPDARQESDLLTLPQVGHALGCSRRTVFRLLSEDAFPSAKVGRHRLVRRGDVDAYLERLFTT